MHQKLSDMVEVADAGDHEHVVVKDFTYCELICNSFKMI